MANLGRGERLQVKARVKCAQRAQHRDVVGEFPRRVKSADEVNLGDAECESGFGFLDDLVEGEFVTAFLTGAAIEGAEGAVENAEVGVVDVPVEDVVGNVAVLAFADGVGHRADGVEVVRLKEPQRLGVADAVHAAAGDAFVPKPNSVLMARQARRRPVARTSRKPYALTTSSSCVR